MDAIIEGHVLKFGPYLIPGVWIEEKWLGQCLIRTALTHTTLEGFGINALEEYVMDPQGIIHSA